MTDPKPDDPWAPYIPDAADPWNLRRVVHLHRRGGFGASWDDLQRDLKDGPEASINRLLDSSGQAEINTAFESTSALLADAAVASNDVGRLRAWWVFRMLFTPDPLAERLALMWHNHFATGNRKVNDLALMRHQNDTFRKLGRGAFRDLLKATARDPALLLYLDAPANRKGHPNENLGRELLELFTLGIGHYTEQDVLESARALTGWTVKEGAFQDLAPRHDDGPKTILGRSGKWSGDDLLKILLEQPVVAVRLAGRICGLLMGEKAVNDMAVAALAEGLRSHDLDIGWGVATVLKSRAFFAEPNIRTRVSGPFEFLVGSIRTLELVEPPPSTLVLADWGGRLGQDLFDPPNVGGWPGGRSWLSSRALIARGNYAAELVDGRGIGRSGLLDVKELVQKHGGSDDRAGVVNFLADILFGGEPSPGWRGRISNAVGAEWDANAARQVVALALASPEAQLN
jgi:uncharacterized protein (DUF1800 family)